MSILTKAQILSSKDSKTETVSVPEWGGEVIIKLMSGAEKDAWEEECYGNREPDEQKKFRNVRATLAAFIIVDDAGKQLFTVEEIEKLGEKSRTALDRIWARGSKLNKLSKSDIEELSKNSVSEPNGN